MAEVPRDYELVVTITQCDEGRAYLYQDQQGLDELDAFANLDRAKAAARDTYHYLRWEHVGRVWYGHALPLEDS